MPETRLAKQKNGVPAAKPRPKLPKFVRTEGGGLGIAEHSTEESRNLHELMGTRDAAAMAQLMSSLTTAVMSENDATALNAGAALLAEMEPRNMLERLLMIQAIGAHEQSMRMLRRSMNGGAEGARIYAGLSERFMNTFARQMETLHKMRNGGKQKVTVEHVTVNEGGQAIVGNVDRGREGQGA